MIHDTLYMDISFLIEQAASLKSTSCMMKAASESAFPGAALARLLKACPNACSALNLHGRTVLHEVTAERRATYTHAHTRNPWIHAYIHIKCVCVVCVCVCMHTLTHAYNISTH